MTRTLGYGLLRRANVTLTDGEEVLWLGRPTPSRAARYAVRTASISLIVVALAGVGYLFDIWSLAFGGLGTAIDRGLSPSVAELLGGVAVFLGLGAGGTLLWAKWMAPNTWYAVTTRRLLFLHGRIAASVWLGAYDLFTIQLVDHRDGTGDLLFRRTRSGYDPKSGRVGAAPPDMVEELVQRWSGEGDEQELDVAFLGIRDPHSVRRLILDGYARRRP